MQANRSNRSRSATDQKDAPRRTPPRGMPSAPPAGKAVQLRGEQKPRDILPEQKPVTDDEVISKPPAKWKIILMRIVVGVMLVLALVLAYIFLLLGEPDEESKLTAPAAESVIRMPMNAVESPGDANLQSLADTFGEPILALYNGELTMQRARIFDTAFGGGYARRVTLSYAFADGSVLTADSIRPTSAVTLLGGSGYSLNANTLYGLGGVDAARMDGAQQLVVFGQTDAAVYAITCPNTHAADVSALLKQTTLVTPTVSN